MTGVALPGPRATLATGALPVLPKLEASDRDGPTEREAERMAALALRSPVQAGPSPPDAPEAKSSANATSGTSRDVLGSSGRALDAPVRKEFESRFGHNFSRIRIHTDRTAAEAAGRFGAVAFSLGQDIAFSTGAYAPHTTGGKDLLAHELAHTIQAKEGVAPDRVHCRRVPSSAHLAADLPPAADVAGLAEVTPGLARAHTRSWVSLTTSRRARVRTSAAGFGIAFTDEASLLAALSAATRDQLRQFGDALRTAQPGRALGDPALIDSGPRPGTRDAVNTTAVVGHANALFAIMAGTTRDAHLTQVFGSAANVAAAKTKYANAKTQMDALHTAVPVKIVTDRSGSFDEMYTGGLSNSSQIAVHSSVIDQPSSRDSRVALLHEAMHAGNADVGDLGYIHQPSFTVMAEPDKLNNAAHYEVVPRRVLGMRSAFHGLTFTPAGSGGTPVLTSRQQAIRDATEEFTDAWTAVLNLHQFLIRLFRTPSEWATLDLAAEFSGAQAGSRFSTTLPFWSKVELLTIHRRLATINPAGPSARHPVTTIDIALSEGLARKLYEGSLRVPATPAEAGRFETAHASAAELAAATTAATERDLLLRLVIRAHLGSLTGNEARDLRVVRRLAVPGAANDFADMLQVRPASAFP